MHGGLRLEPKSSLTVPSHSKPIVSERGSEASQADDAAGELEQSEVEVGSYLVAGPEAFELVEPGEGPFDDPPRLAQAGSVDGAPAGDLGCDAARAEQASVFVVGVAAVGEQSPWSVTGPPDPAADVGDGVAARTCAVDRRRSGVSPL